MKTQQQLPDHDDYFEEVREDDIDDPGPRKPEIHLSSVVIALIGVTLLSLAILAWAVTLNNKVLDLESNLEDATSLNTTLRENANATVYTLVPTELGPENANGRAYFSVEGSGVLSVANMPALPTDQEFQFWYVTDDPLMPVPGGTFTINMDGVGFMLIPADVQGVTSISISMEPKGGSQSPTGPMLLTSDISDARG